MFAFSLMQGAGAARPDLAQPIMALRHFSVWRWWFAAALLLALVALLMPASAVLALKIWVVSWWPGAQTLANADASQYADKWVHGAMFAVLGALGLVAWRTRRQRCWLGLGLLLLAPVTELLQQLVPGRSASVGDALADVLGLLLVGLLLWHWTSDAKAPQ